MNVFRLRENKTGSSNELSPLREKKWRKQSVRISSYIGPISMCKYKSGTSWDCMSVRILL